MQRRSIPAGVMLALLVGPALFATNGAFLTSNGVKTQGRGGVDFGIADDATAIHSNPAGLAFIWGNQLDQSFFLIDPRLNTRNEFGRWRPEHRIIPGASFGVVFEIGRSWRVGETFDFGADYYSGEEMAVAPWQDEYPNNLKLGFGIFPISGGKVDYDMFVDHFETDQPLSREYFSDLSVVAFSPAIAYRFNKYFAVGASVDIAHGKLELDLPIVQDGRQVLQGQTTLGISFGEALATGQALGLSQTNNITGFSDIDFAQSVGIGGRIGIYINPTEDLSLGLVYVFPTRMADYLGDVEVDYTDQIASLQGGDLQAANTLIGLLAPAGSGFDPALGYVGAYDVRVQGFHLPQQVAFGAGYRVRVPDTDVSAVFGFDAKWIEWRPVAKNFKSRLSNGNNINLNILTGGPSVHARLPLRWRNQVVLAIGASVNLSKSFTFRLGYNFGKTPVQAKTASPVLPAIGEHHLAWGMTYKLGFWEFHFAMEHTARNGRRALVNIHDPAFNRGSTTASLTAYWFGFSVHF